MASTTGEMRSWIMMTLNETCIKHSIRSGFNKQFIAGFNLDSTMAMITAGKLAILVITFSAIQLTMSAATTTRSKCDFSPSQIDDLVKVLEAQIMFTSETGIAFNELQLDDDIAFIIRSLEECGVTNIPIPPEKQVQQNIQG